MKESDILFGLLISFYKKEFSFSDLTWLTAPFNISETSLRTNLSRMIGNKILSVRKEGKKAFYSLTNKSKRISSNVVLSFHKPNWSNWDNDWWGISISLPKNSSSQRYYINKKLVSYRFAALHPGFWIRPFNKNEEIERRLINTIRNRNTKVIVFKFSSEEDLLNIPALWNIKEINLEYKACIDYITMCYDDYNLENPQEALVGKMTIGNIVVKQLFKDPLLPEIFLPDDWLGDSLRTAFKKWDSLTTLKSKLYWKQIFSDKESSTIINQNYYGRKHQLAM
ncbi:MAG: hypothetical protein KAR19_17820 [Bacteroidales bacterium]|nr:hypothetical protein [Bacteroidales bacterium]